MAFADPVTLSGALVELAPTSLADVAELGSAAEDGRLWTLWYTSVPRPEAMGAHVEMMLAAQAAGTIVPFTTRRVADGRVIGMTTYLNIEAAHRRLEIGHTWNAQSAHGSGTNAESKLLLLTHAFDELGCNAVEFRTHWLNHQSRRAIERLGAKQDGVMRAISRYRNGALRDSVEYSIIEPEWPAVRANLEMRLSRRK